jgi:glycosyltransferase XagB
MNQAEQAVSGRVVTVPADASGADPLVRRYLDRFRATCAFHTISWAWMVVAILIVIAGGWIGNFIAGIPELKPSSNSPVVILFFTWFGNPWGTLIGMFCGAALAHALRFAGLLISAKLIVSGHESWCAFTVLTIVYLACYDLLVFASVVTGVLCVVYLLAIVFRLIALEFGAQKGLHSDDLSEPAEGWPVYTVLVPLYKERNVAGNILHNLAKLDYPLHLLDVKFLLEADDPDTLAALTAAGIPPWAEVVIVPQGQPKTKPRACNHGLERARGSFLVVYDAEDRPEPDQLKQAVIAFANVAPNVICLQAQLAYHNHRQNMLTRWFALEYNVWFGRYLAGLERMGVPIPLGGTSNHFRRQELLDIGGWDPFNVTEDCDLGVRLHINGFVTRILRSTTWEEANSRFGNWVRQRSRWLKGYLITFLVWSRRPLRLVTALGPWSALGFFLSVFCVAALSAFNLILWLVTGVYFTLIAIDVSRGHALWSLLTTRDLAHDRLSWPMMYSGLAEDTFWSGLSQIFFSVSICLLIGNVAFIIVNLWAGRRAGQRGLTIAALLSPVYWVMISIGAWKGIWQLLVRPHYWEKTVHGLDHGSTPP